MLVETGETAKGAGAQVAFVAVAVPGLVRGLVLPIVVPADEVLGDETARVFGPNESENGLAVEVGGAGTGTSLEVMGHAGGRGKRGRTEGALGIGATVRAGVEMLRWRWKKRCGSASQLADGLGLQVAKRHPSTYRSDVVGVHKESVARLAVVVIVNLVLPGLLDGGPGLVAVVDVAVVCKVVPGVLVLPLGVSIAKDAVAPIALEQRGGMASCIAVLVARSLAGRESAAASAALEHDGLLAVLCSPCRRRCWAGKVGRQEGGAGKRVVVLGKDG